MNFQKGLIYHVFNQGNNRQQIFFNQRNYLFFLRKMEKHLKPHADILAYCLMPNHFHWLLHVHSVEILNHKGVAKPLNNNIGILLRSYARAINIQEGRTGSLFRQRTKSKNGLIQDVITIDGPNAQEFFKHGNEYILQCFRYIHMNPVKAGLVSSPEDWPWSSAQEYAFSENGQQGICNLELGVKLLSGLK
jgi:putative transposase